MMLGDLGARVIKVESATGDDTRAWGPPWAGPETEDGRRDSTYFLSANRNKESIVLDLKSADGRAVLERLVARADVLLENFRSGVLDRLGLTVERLHELNPLLVIGKITGFGHDGPESDRAGYDQIAQGEGGLMSVTGTEQPTKVGVPIADLLAGMNLAYGVTAALHERHRTGRGRVVRTSLLAGVVGVHAFQGTRWTVAGEVPGISGAHHPAIAPYGLFATGTTPLQVAVGSEGLWRTFATALGLDPLTTRASPINRDRVAHRDELVAAIERVLGHRLRRPLAHRAARGRHPRRQGARDGRGLRVGPDPLAGTGPRRRPPGVRLPAAQRLAAALRRQRLLRRPRRPRAPAAPRRARRGDPRLAGRLRSRPPAGAPPVSQATRLAR